jgi:hypothetical protein
VEEVPKAAVSSKPEVARVTPSAKPAAVPSATPTTLARVEPSPVAVASPSPSPEPSPTPLVFNPNELKRLEVLFPKGRARLTVAAGTQPPSVDMDLKWVGRPAGMPLRLSLNRLFRKAGGIARKEIFVQGVKTTAAPQETRRRILTPGEYEWEFQGPNGESLASIAKSFVPFTVEREFPAIKTNRPLVAGEVNTSSRIYNTVLKKFDVKLSWQPYPEAKDYQLWVGADHSLKQSVYQEKTQGTAVSLSKAGMRQKMFYRVTAVLPSGFVAASPTETFIFDYLPPLLTQPGANARFTRLTLRAQNNSVLFTWQMTNFTTEYVFEVATDAQFQRMVFEQAMKENFFAMQAPPAGTYYWRVRSRGQGVESSPSETQSFTILK